MLEDMNALPEHPSLNLPVTEAQRDRAEQWLQQAYADGRISADEFDRRIGQVISSVSRRDLNLAFYGLVKVAPTSQALGVHPIYQPTHPTVDRAGVGVSRGMAALAHFSALGSSFFGPLLFFLLSPEGGPTRREAAKAFNFQVLALLSLVATFVVGQFVPEMIAGLLYTVVTIGWLVLTVVGGAKAAQGDDWRNPATRVLPMQILREK